MFNLRLLPLCAAVVLFTGCASAVHQPAPGYRPAPRPAPSATTPAPAPAVVAPIPEPAPAAAAPNPAVTSLLGQARAQYQARNYQGAIATAERALRIDRRAADIYLLLAQSYLQLDQPHKAKMFVQQGLRYAQPQSEAAQGLLRVQEIAGGN